MKIPIVKPNIYWLRKFVAFRHKVNDFWHVESGDWHWLADKPMSIKGLNRKLWRASVPSASFYGLLSISAIISTFGLLGNSVATIIGAMIVAPLMGPIISVAYALVVGNRRLLKRSAVTVWWGVVISVLFSMVISFPLGFSSFGSEVTSRISPSLLDMGVALAAGAAGAFAQSRRHVADALPGVAIAVALVPPLSVIGIGLSAGNFRIAGGASLLFITNLIGIIFSSCIIFLIQRYGSVERAKTGLFAGFISIFVLAVPLGFSLRSILVRESVRREVVTILKRRTITFKDVSVESIQTQSMSDGTLMIELEVISEPATITARQVQLVKTFLAAQFERPIRLQIKVIPAEFFEE